MVGTPLAFALAVTTVVVWGVLGPFFHYSDTWQLVINTGTTIITFLIVFPYPKYPKSRIPHHPP